MVIILILWRLVAVWAINCCYPIGLLHNRTSGGEVGFQMINDLELWLNNLSAVELLFFYFWALLVPASSVAWLIESVCLKLFKRSRNDWRILK